MDFDALFKASFTVKENGSGRVMVAVKMPDAFRGSLPDRFVVGEMTHVWDEVDTYYDRTRKEVVRDVITHKDVVPSKILDFEKGHFHGGQVNLQAGDYLVFDGDTYFGVPAKTDLHIGEKQTFAARFTVMK